jgi:hypothetical protein
MLQKERLLIIGLMPWPPNVYTHGNTIHERIKKHSIHKASGRETVKDTKRQRDRDRQREIEKTSDKPPQNL